ncbi:MAG: hypothetical protein QW175_03295 [Candidatus Bathyarchaeia archaeon]
MEKLFKRVSSLAIVALLFLSAVAVFPVYASPAPIYLVPSEFKFTTATAAPGTRFVAAVWVGNVEHLYSFQFIIEIDDELLNITRAWLPPLDDTQYVFYGKSTVRPTPTLYDSDGDGVCESVLVGDSIMGPGEFSGTGKLGFVEFEIIKAPGKYETLSCPIHFVPSETFGQDPNLQDISFEPQDGYYEFKWLPPAVNPTIAIRPEYFPIDQYTNVSTLPSPHVSVDLKIENLELGWALHNASFKITYNTPQEILSLVGVDPAPEWATAIIDTSVPNEISIYVEGHTNPVGNIRVATLKFDVTYQGINPPQAESNVSDIKIVEYQLMNTVGPIPVDRVVNGKVEVQPFLILPLPKLSVIDPRDGDTLIELGPELWVGDQFGKTFQVNVVISELHFAWKLIGVQFRLGYDPTLIEVIDVKEGPFLKYYAKYGTFPIVYIETNTIYGPHILFGDIILPNETGSWDWMPNYRGWPQGEGVLATITFRPLKQSWTENYTAPLPLKDIILVNKDLGTISFLPPEHGTYRMLTIGAVGRVIDVWMQYPAPYGGQGPNQPADLVVPQQEVCLTAKVTYNWWPVQGKLVTFKVFDNTGKLYAIFQATTGADGHASVCFRMPWPGENYFGVWTVVASVSVADVVISDTMTFHYDYLVQTWKVTTNKLEYKHLETVTIKVEFGTHAQQEYTVWMAVEIQDELGVVVGITVIEITIGGAEYCTYTNYTSTVTIQIPYNAYAGKATVCVNFLSTPPEECGPAVTPEATTTIWILPL